MRSRWRWSRSRRWRWWSRWWRGHGGRGGGVVVTAVAVAVTAVVAWSRWWWRGHGGGGAVTAVVAWSRWVTLRGRGRGGVGESEGDGARARARLLVYFFTTASKSRQMASAVASRRPCWHAKASSCTASRRGSSAESEPGFAAHQSRRRAASLWSTGTRSIAWTKVAGRWARNSAAPAVGAPRGPGGRGHF